MKNLTFTLALLFGQFLNAQTPDETLFRMYWNYRDIYKKYFTEIGQARGQSVVGDRIFRDGNGASAIYSDPFTYDVGTDSRLVYTGSDPLPQYWGYRNYGDATLDYDNYLGVLATEYWLLKNYHHDQEALNAVKNEIYLALNAIDRLDGWAEVYYNASNPMTYNGFFVRDDLPHDHMIEFRLNTFRPNKGSH